MFHLPRRRYEPVLTHARTLAVRGGVSGEKKSEVKKKPRLLSSRWLVRKALPGGVRRRGAGHAKSSRFRATNCGGMRRHSF